MKLALDHDFIGFVTNEARNKLASSQCPKYSGTVCSRIPSPKDLSKGRKLNKSKLINSTIKIKLLRLSFTTKEQL